MPFRSSGAVAKLVSWRIASMEERFYRPVRPTGSTGTESLFRRKLGMMGDLGREYARLQSFGSEWVPEALGKRAALDLAFANEVGAFPVPSGLTDSETARYRETLNQNIVGPFRKKALASATRCLAESARRPMPSRATAACFGVASAVEPNRYPAVGTFFPSLVHAALVTPGIGTESSVAEWLMNDDEAAFVGIPITLSALRATLAPQPVVVGRGPASERGQRLIESIRSALAERPGDASLRNALAVVHLALGNIATARALWMSMLGEGQAKAVVLNNLGALLLARGNERDALGYFAASARAGRSPALSLNLGVMALRARHGTLAARELESVSSGWAHSGLVVARIQGGDLSGARGRLQEAADKDSRDVFAVTSLAYLLRDGERDGSAAREIARRFIEHGDETDEVTPLRALVDSKTVAQAGSR